MTEVRSGSCTACPYRRDVPSGVWELAEYEKLRGYDLPTMDQPMATFRCHVTPETLCHGWVAVHENRGHEYELIALRIWPLDGEIPPKDPTLFDSGNEAADHGQTEYHTPSRESRATAQRLLRKYPRLRAEGEVEHTPGSVTVEGDSSVAPELSSGVLDKERQ